MIESGVVERMRADAREASRLHDESRRLLLASVRAGAAAGLTQRQISEAVGRSQPEVSRLLRFHGRTPLAHKLEADRRAVLAGLSGIGARNVRVFGSVARGDDGPDSDVDLLVDFDDAPSLFELARAETGLARLLGAPVDIVPSVSLRSNLAQKILDEAVPL